ncbi:MAG: Xaa-Pro peptidase family protein [Ardenticatenaceae bacterium]|nr:Xaa-Pro peptidase family protein [Ardenticatenaceae bacterium]
MHREQRDQTHQYLQSHGIGRALLADPANITWLSGVPQPWRAGSFLYAGGPSLLWYEDGHYTLIMMDGHAAAAGNFAAQPDCTLITYTGYAYLEQPAGARLLLEALREVVRGSGQATLGVEMQAVPAAILEGILAEQPPAVNVVPIDGGLVPMRMIRTAEEIAIMRQNFELIAQAQAVCPMAVQPGRTELDVWHAIHTALQSAAGETLFLGNDCTVGRRGGGPAQAVKIMAGDSFIVDLSTIWQGYWSDSCVTYYATEPTPEQAKMHRATADALDLAISLARPGAICRDIDQAVRRFLSGRGYPTYPHHTGHGIGVVGHEAPRVTPHSTERLEPGMVIMLEPGIYEPGVTGVRLEHAVLIGESGPELLTHYDLNLPD